MDLRNQEPVGRRGINCYNLACLSGSEGGSHLILGGDIGGTKCNLVLFQEAEGATLQPVFQRRYATRDFSRFEDLVAHFLKQSAEQGATSVGARISAAGFGVAGAVVEGRLHANNLPWKLNSPELASRLDVNLENIVLAQRCGCHRVEPRSVAREGSGGFEPGSPAAESHPSLMAVGTGLGEAFLVWEGRQERVFPSEGGLAGFAPRTDREIQLLIFLKKRLPQVCCEDVLSGRGIRAIHEFLDPGVRHPSFDDSGGDPARDISRASLIPLLSGLCCDPRSMDRSLWL